MHEETPPIASSGLRNAIVSAIIASVIPLLGMIAYISQTEGRFDVRLSTVESRQVTFASDVGRLDQARENTDIHLTKVDGKMSDMDGKISAILDILQRWEQSPAENNGGETRSAPNFPRPSPRR